MKTPLFGRGGHLGWRLALIILLGIVSTQVATIILISLARPTEFLLYRQDDIVRELQRRWTDLLQQKFDEQKAGDLLLIERLARPMRPLPQPQSDAERAPGSPGGMMHRDFQRRLRIGLPQLSDADIVMRPPPPPGWLPLEPLRGRPRPVVMGLGGPEPSQSGMQPGLPPGPPPNDLIPANFAIDLRLPNGEWVAVRSKHGEATGGMGPRWLLVTVWLLVMAAIIALLAALASRHLIRPLGRIAEAAGDWRAEIEPKPLPEQGPTEFRAIAGAFNAMREKIHRFVRDRTEMVVALSHDLRTPLTRLRLRTEYVEDAEQRQRFLDDLRFMERIIEQLLSFAAFEKQEETMERVDIAALLQTLCDDRVDAGATIEYEGPRRCVLRCRPTAIHRTLMNLLDNAAKYSDYTLVNLREMSDEVIVLIADSGPGIPEAELEAVLRPFYRVDTARAQDTGGLGMGLHVANRVVQDHGGKLILRNRHAPDGPSSGLEVEVHLPRQ